MGFGQSKEEKAQQYKHIEEMQRIRNGHELKMQIFDQLKAQFQNVNDPDMNYNICVGYIMQTFGTGNTFDTDLFRELTSKLPPGLPPNLQQVIANVIDQMEQGEGDSLTQRD